MLIICVLAADGVSDEVFLDGSDSAMLYANDRFYVHQGYMKDHTNTIGVGFQLFAPVIDVPGRSWRHLA